MNATTAITVGISIAGFIIGIIIKVAGRSTKFGQMTQKLESNEVMWKRGQRFEISS